MQTAVIVGAGVSGLQAARALLKRGFAVVVLEAENTIGGVWSRNYVGYGLQVPYTCYQFGEYPWTREMLDAHYPSATAVRNYIQGYAAHFGLLDFIKFRCKLERVSPRSAGGWVVTYLDRSTNKQESLVTDYVVISTGLYATPKLPEYKNCHQFKGSQMHAKEFRDASIADGKRVVVIGAGKTALDCAAEVVVSSRAASVTWLFRQVHWPIPRMLDIKLPLGRTLQLPIERTFYSNVQRLLVPAFYDDALSKRTLLKVLQPAQSLLWKALEGVIAKQFQLKGIIAPTMSLRQDLMFSGSIIDSTWHELVDLQVTESKERPKTSKGLQGGWWACWRGGNNANSSNNSSSSSKAKRGSSTGGQRSGAASSGRSDKPGSMYGKGVEAASNSRSRRSSVVSSSKNIVEKEEEQEEDEHISPMSSSAGSSRQSSCSGQGSSNSRQAGSSNQGSGRSTPRRGSWRTDLALASAAMNISQSSKQLERAVEAAVSVSRSRNQGRTSGRTQQDNQELQESGRRSRRVSGTPSRASSACPSRRNSGNPDPERRSAQSSGRGGERCSTGNRRSNSAPPQVTDTRAASPSSPKISDVPLPKSWGERRQQALELREKERRERMARAPRISRAELETCVNIKPMRGEVSQFTHHGVTLTNGRTLPADLVLYCTGYNKTYDYLDPSIKAALSAQKDGLYLYRSIIPPTLPRLAFVGSEVSTLDNILTAGLQAEWLAEHWCGAKALPSPEEMGEDIQKQIKWRRQLIPTQSARGSVYGIYMQQYHGQLMKDMGFKPPKMKLGQLFTPLTADDYEKVFVHSSIACKGSVVLSSKDIAAAAASRGVLVPRVEEEAARAGVVAATSCSISHSASDAAAMAAASSSVLTRATARTPPALVAISSSPRGGAAASRGFGALVLDTEGADGTAGFGSSAARACQEAGLSPNPQASDRALSSCKLGSFSAAVRQMQEQRAAELQGGLSSPRSRLAPPSCCSEEQSGARSASLLSASLKVTPSFISAAGSSCPLPATPPSQLRGAAATNNGMTPTDTACNSGSLLSGGHAGYRAYSGSYETDNGYGLGNLACTESLQGSNQYLGTLPQQQLDATASTAVPELLAHLHKVLVQVDTSESGAGGQVEDVTSDTPAVMEPVPGRQSLVAAAAASALNQLTRINMACTVADDLYELYGPPVVLTYSLEPTVHVRPPSEGRHVWEA